jgi:hypothetical protein
MKDIVLSSIVIYQHRSGQKFLMPSTETHVTRNAIETGKTGSSNARSHKQGKIKKCKGHANMERFENKFWGDTFW